ncbi:hypothetical protein G9A89_019340, partial [Geosiphon pyriformis]
GPDGREHSVVYISKSLSSAEKNYGTPALEYLVIYWAVIKWKKYLIITKPEKETILFNMHSDPTAKHFHKEATMERIRKRYY